MLQHPISGVVLAGGASRRFGGAPKGLAAFRGLPMAQHAARLLEPICTGVSIEAPRGAGYDALALPLVHARAEHEGKGPLAGIVAGLESDSCGTVAFAPCDMPLLTIDVYRSLIAACAGCAGAFAVSPAGQEPLVAVLKKVVLATVVDALSGDAVPGAHTVLRAAGATAVSFDNVVPFTNVNSPEELARLERR